jgi:hypothetical protein
MACDGFGAKNSLTEKEKEIKWFCHKCREIWSLIDYEPLF